MDLGPKDTLLGKGTKIEILVREDTHKKSVFF